MLKGARCCLSVGKGGWKSVASSTSNHKNVFYSLLRSLDINNSFNVSIAFLSSDVFLIGMSGNVGSGLLSWSAASLAALVTFSGWVSRSPPLRVKTDIRPDMLGIVMKLLPDDEDPFEGLAASAVAPVLDEDFVTNFGKF